MKRFAAVCLVVAVVAVGKVSAASEGDDRSAEGAPPVELSGQAMFRYTWKLSDGARNSAEVYNLRLYLDRSFEGITAHAEPRLRQTPLRSFSPSNVWIQQAWVAFDAYADTFGTLRGGLIYNRLGLAWDRSWFGNLVYLNGLKLDPDYGVEFSGAPGFSLGGGGTLSLEYGLQYLPVEDGLNGFFAPEFKRSRLGARIDGGTPLDFDSAPGHTERHMVVAEVHPKVSVGAFEFRAGGSGMVRQIERARRSDRPPATGRETVYGAEVEARWRGASMYGEVLRQDRIGFGNSGARDRTDYALGGVAGRWEWEGDWWRALEARVNASGVRYRDEGVGEWFLAPGLHVRLHRLAGVTAEYVRWEFDGRGVVNRVEWILHGCF